MSNAVSVDLVPYAEAVDKSAQLTKGQSFLSDLKRFHVKSEEDYRMAGEGVRHCKTVLATFEDKRKAVTGPLNKAKQEVDGWFRELRAPYEEAESYLKQQLLEYQARQEQERVRLAGELKAAAGDVPQIMTLAAQAQQTIPPPLAGIQNRVVKKWRVVNEDLVPRQVMTIDTYKVHECMKQGITIPGIEYYEEQIIAARRS